MLPDPLVRDDGICALDGCGTQLHPERAVKYAGMQAYAEPFCSTVCCREYHGAVPPEPSHTAMHAPIAA